mgnify:CR=1 FL=1
MDTPFIIWTPLSVHSVQKAPASLLTFVTFVAWQGRRNQQHSDIEDIAELLGVSHFTATLLLRSVAWSKEDLLSRYMDDPDKVRGGL